MNQNMQVQKFLNETIFSTAECSAIYSGVWVKAVSFLTIPVKIVPSFLCSETGQKYE